MITRYDVSSGLPALKDALSAMGLFSSVTLDNESTPTTVTCKDSNDNTLFTVATSGSSMGYYYTAYKNADTSISLGSGTTGSNFIYAYKIGTNGGAILIGSSDTAASTDLMLIGRTNYGAVAFCFPSSVGSHNFGVRKVACWGDDLLLSDNLNFTGSSADGYPMIGNQCLFVPIPMHGLYNRPLYMKNAYFLPMVQAGMRGTLQTITDGDDTYFTNGFVAMLDSEEE